MDNIIADKKLIEAFHLMYDSFQGVAQLNHKSKLVVAANPAAQVFGRLAGIWPMAPGWLCSGSL